MSNPASSPEHVVRCPACHYDLTGTPTTPERCPECGESLEASTLAHARERRFFQRLKGQVLIALMVLAIALIVIVILFPERRVVMLPLLILVVGASAPALLAVLSREV